MGSITISGSGIENLNGLSVLTSINGDLFIRYNNALTSLTGLKNLNSISGSLRIVENYALINLTGLDSIDSIGGYLIIGGNTSLTSLTGLEKLTSIGEGLWIGGAPFSSPGNKNLVSLTGLENLTSIGLYLVIVGNDSLKSLSGLNNLTSIATFLAIEGNNILTTLTGLEKLTSIGTNLWIGNNDTLSSLSGLCHLISIGGDLGIQGNPALAICAIEGVCAYLSNPPGTISISANAPGCNNLAEVEAACLMPVNTAPAAFFDFTITGQTAAFTNHSQNAGSYLWDFGDGLTDTLPDPAHTYLNDGSYKVILIAANPCSTDTATKTVVIATSPVAGFTATPISGCFPLTVQFTNASSSNAVFYNWIFPDGSPSISTEKNPTVLYNQPGNYNVTLVVSNAQGTDIDTQSNFIHVLGPPAVSFNFTSDGQTVEFTNSSQGANSCFWDFGDGQTSTEFNPIHVYDPPGNYTVTLICFNPCGTGTQQLVGTDAPAWLRTLRLSPNPNTGQFSVALSGMPAGTVEFTLYSPDGRLLHRETVETATDGGLVQAFDFGDLPPALYLFQLRSGTGTAMLKVLVQR